MLCLLPIVFGSHTSIEQKLFHVSLDLMKGCLQLRQVKNTRLLKASVLIHVLLGAEKLDAQRWGFRHFPLLVSVRRPRPVQTVTTTSTPPSPSWYSGTAPLIHLGSVTVPRLAWKTASRYLEHTHYAPASLPSLAWSLSAGITSCVGQDEIRSSLPIYYLI